MSDVLTKALAGQPIQYDDPGFQAVDAVVARNSQLLMQLNTGYRDRAAVNALLEKLIQRPVAPMTTLLPPLQTDFGGHIFLGRGVFINRNCMLVDLGGIYIGDRVLIGPNVTILTVNHEENPATRRNLRCQAVHVEAGAWLGANVTVLPGVTIGENAIVGAGSLVTKDVPADTVVIGSPAKVLRKIIMTD